MGISQTKAKEHIEKWCEILRTPSGHSYRTKWPKYLFHHASLQNAVGILKEGSLLSRNAASKLVHDDVAPTEVISRRDDAHDFARLYFRPKTPTQYLVEGIRKPEDCYLGDTSNHIPVLYMFMFSAETILTLQETHFSNGNMQSPQTTFGDTEAAFDLIQFQKVFHNSSFDQIEKSTILRSRCAEVLTQSPLQIGEHLKFILCRSESERNTLLYAYPEATPSLRSRIRTFTEVGIFQSEFTYVRGVDLFSQSCLIQFSPRRDGKPISCELFVKNHESKIVRHLPTKDIDSSKRLRVNFGRALDTGSFEVEVWLEGNLAYRNSHLLDDLPF